MDKFYTILDKAGITAEDFTGHIGVLRNDPTADEAAEAHKFLDILYDLAADYLATRLTTSDDAELVGKTVQISAKNLFNKYGQGITYGNIDACMEYGEWMYSIYNQSHELAILGTEDAEVLALKDDVYTLVSNNDEIPHYLKLTVDELAIATKADNEEEKGLDNPDNVSEFAAKFPTGLIIRVSEGTGDNLLREDIEAGYIDYINYGFLNENMEEEEGGMMLLKELYQDLFATPRDVLKYLLDDLTELGLSKLDIDRAIFVREEA